STSSSSGWLWAATRSSACTSSWGRFRVGRTMETDDTLPPARWRRSGGSRANAACLGHEHRALLDTAHLETQVAGANLHLHRRGLEIPLDRVGHRLREALLQARHAGQLAHQARDRADAA